MDLWSRKYRVVMGSGLGILGPCSKHTKSGGMTVCFVLFERRWRWEVGKSCGDEVSGLVFGGERSCDGKDTACMKRK